MKVFVASPNGAIYTRRRKKKKTRDMQSLRDWSIFRDGPSRSCCRPVRSPPRITVESVRMGFDVIGEAAPPPWGPEPWLATYIRALFATYCLNSVICPAQPP